MARQDDKHDLIDRLRVRAHDSLSRLPGRLGDRLRGLNLALGQPLASDAELAEKRAFERGLSGEAASGQVRAPGAGAVRSG
ncbi:MAG TPA: hypothetical protein PKU97_05785, partial [Kofleriaceae bacterium]|nr:hypothetical protein [Kofleriaceae bacterium]